MKHLITFALIVLAVMKSYGTDELTKIIGCHWCDPAIQRLFASHFVKKYSTTIIRDPISTSVTSNRLYIVGDLSQTNALSWDHIDNSPNRGYIPYIEIRTATQSNSDRPETITSVEVFHSRFGDVVLPGLAKSLRIPMELMDYALLANPPCISNVAVWTWNKATINDSQFEDVDNHPENGKVTYNAASNRTITIWFDANRLYSIRLACATTSQQKENAPLCETSSDLSFVKIGARRIISVDTNMVSRYTERERRTHTRLETVVDRWTECYRHLHDLGYQLEQEKTYIAPPFPIASRLYVSPCKNVIIETNLDKRLAMTIESVICAYVNVKKGGGSAGIKMPGDLHLPETPEECCRRFKCRYSQSSRDGKRLLLCCQGGTFLFIENKLDQACFYGEDRTSGSIYDLKFNE